MKKITFLTILFINVICFSQISINEIDSDQTGTDTQEFIELFSATPGFSLDGYIVVLYNGSDDLSYKTIDLNGFTTDGEGYFIIGDDAVTGIDISLGASNKIQNGPDAVAIYQDLASNFPNDTPVTSVNLIDAIVYGTDDDDDPELLAGLGETTQYDEDLNGNKETESLQLNNSGEYCTTEPTLRALNSCQPLGVFNTSSSSFQLHPNPTDTGYVNISSNTTGPKNITIFDVLGKQVMKTTLTSQRLDVSSLRSGIYILKIEEGRKSATLKLIIK